MEPPFFPVLEQCTVELGADTKQASGSDDRGSGAADVLFMDLDWRSIRIDSRSSFKQCFGDVRGLNDENLPPEKSAVYQVA
jgi:hypothetical protein